MATTPNPKAILYRRLDTNHDPVEGGGLSNYLTGVDAVAQAVQTRLLLFQGEWWENTLDGLPLFQKILGAAVGAQQEQYIAQLITARIRGTLFVTNVLGVQVSINKNTRNLTFQATVQTQFGEFTVANYPTPPSVGV